MIRGIAKIDSSSVRNYESTDFTALSALRSTQFTATNQIDSICVMDRPITIKYKGCEHSTHIADFKIEITENQQPHATLSVGVENARKSENGTVFRFDLNVILTLRVSAIEFVNIENKIDKNLSISIYGRPKEEIKFDSEDEWEFTELDDLVFTYRIGKLPKISWYQESLRAQNDQFLRPLSIKRRGHVGAILDELSQSAAEVGLIFDRYDKRLEIICEIIPELRVALREWKQAPTENDYGTNLWAYSPEDFKVSIAGLDKSEQKELEEQYDTLWGNFEAASAISNGENNYGAASKGFEPNSEELDSIGGRYLNLSPLRSKTLEKILINSLLYIETVSYARTIKPNKKQFGSAIGLRIYSDAKKDDGYWGLTKTFGTNLSFYAKYIGSEVLKIGLTFGASLVVTNENLAVSWAITIGYTLFRWWRQVHLIQNEPAVKQSSLLVKMIEVQLLANKRNFNAQYTRTRLEKAGDEGAVFSPLVFSILDRQINLDSSFKNTSNANSN